MSSDAPAAPGADAPSAKPRPELDALEARTLGVLIEKALTTPEQYPLSLNGLTAGANQKSNRHPVLDLDDHEYQAALNRLRGKGLASLVHLSGSRVDKFRHTAREALDLDGPDLAVMAELLLRGPQMPGELRTRVSRMVKLDTLEGLELVLSRLAERGFVRRLPPSPGSRAPRWVQLIAPGLHPLDEVAAPSSGSDAGAGIAPAAGASASRRSALEERVDALEAEVRALREELAAIKNRIGD